MISLDGFLLIFGREREREMGGKGRKRREKNYRAAHGGPTRLPPPPDPSQIDALPSKLRQLISFTSTLHGSTDTQTEKKRNIRGDGDGNTHKKRDGTNLEATRIKDGGDDRRVFAPQRVDSGDEIVENGEKGKKREEKAEGGKNQVLIVSAPLSVATHPMYLEAKKNKHKKAKTEENLDFPGRENVKFGDVVEAPPKLVSVPKAFKNVASQERLRLQAVEAYRNRKGWTSRPGIQLPPVTTAP
ncbi:hypothetical protein JRO89_XS01G0302700 [Xanthoceras sorbifolium]|uniref:Uncharacterized protein n=1 Tax=Xanthoceras sorbifolium TaxID=99658 RepID=A0ABQ8IMH9_9ROSI|nr:hypothetical protein JRO89_XS01G0302700 [Xanthoceras sorbifolium]